MAFLIELIADVFRLHVTGSFADKTAESINKKLPHNETVTGEGSDKDVSKMVEGINRESCEK